MNQKQLKDLIQKGESEVVEFKGSLKLHNSIGEAISAFSNSKGGIIIVGSEDSGKISGVSIGDNTLEKLANRIKQDTDPSIYPKISSNKLDGKDMIVIEIEDVQDYIPPSSLTVRTPMKNRSSTKTKLTREWERVHTD